MGNFGRYVCVALPFLLTLGALISLLVGGLAGVTGNKENLYMFRVNTTGLQVKPTDLRGLVGARDAAAGPELLARQELANLTAADLGLHKLYDVSLWGFCFDPQSGGRQCLQPKFNWAETEINATMSKLTETARALGRNVTIPGHITDALNLYSTVARWTQVVFIIAYVALGIELLLGIAANCSRAVSCLTWIVAGVASLATMGAAALATATAVVVIGAVEGTAKWFGVRASLNANFLAAVWLAVAFALAAGFFWLFTVCCCKPDHSSSRKSRGDFEKGGVPMGSYGSYTPINDSHQNSAGFYNGNQQPSFYNNQPTAYGAPQYPTNSPSELAREPLGYPRR